MALGVLSWILGLKRPSLGGYFSLNPQYCAAVRTNAGHTSVRWTGFDHFSADCRGSYRVRTFLQPIRPFFYRVIMCPAHTGKEQMIIWSLGPDSVLLLLPDSRQIIHRPVKVYGNRWGDQSGEGRLNPWVAPYMWYAVNRRIQYRVLPLWRPKLTAINMASEDLKVFPKFLSIIIV